MSRVKRGMATKKRHKRLLNKPKVFGDNVKIFLKEHMKHCCVHGLLLLKAENYINAICVLYLFLVLLLL